MCVYSLRGEDEMVITSNYWRGRYDPFLTSLL